MRSFTPSVVCLVLSTVPAFAQWSHDPAQNNAVADRANDQVQPKLAVAPGEINPGTYVSWFDNASGGYDVYLQRYTGAGVEAWAHNGVLLADRGFSSTVDYALISDGTNAYVAFNDDRPATGVSANHITVVKVDPAGAQPWGATGGASGVHFSNSTFPANPKLAFVGAPLPQPRVYVGWSEDGTVHFQAIGAVSGVPLWASDVVLTDAGHPLTLSDIQPMPDGGFVALWIRPTTTSFLSPKHLFAMRFNTTGQAMWASPTIVFDANSIQNGTFPTFSVGLSGFSTFSWYETGGTRNCYVQRLRPDGTEMFPHNGFALSTTANIRLDPAIATAGGEFDAIYAAWSETNQTQSQFNLVAQKVLITGGGSPERAWNGAAGGAVELMPTTTNQKSFVRATLGRDTFFVACINATGPTTGEIFTTMVNFDGTVSCRYPVTASTANSGKGRLTLLGLDVGGVLAWHDSRADANNVYAQAMSFADGALGRLGSNCPADLDDDGDLANGGNPDGGVTIDDLIYFLRAFEAGALEADLDDGEIGGIRDCGVGIDDLIFYLIRFESAC